MPKYYFDFHDGIDLRDDHGKDCPNIERAKEYARKILPDIAADELPKLKDDKKSFRVTVRNDGDDVVYIAHLDFRGVITEPVIANDFTPFALVADDDVLVRMDAVNILEDAGFRVYEACNVEEAIEILEVSWESIQLLFTDVQMPPGSQNGFDLAQRVAKSWPKISILVSSGEMQPTPGAMPNGAVFIGKPFSAEVVYDRLQQILPNGQQPQQLKKAVKRGS